MEILKLIGMIFLTAGLFAGMIFVSETSESIGDWKACRIKSALTAFLLVLAIASALLTFAFSFHIF